LQNTESALGLKENSKVTVRFGMKIFAAGFHFCEFLFFAISKTDQAKLIYL